MWLVIDLSELAKVRRVSRGLDDSALRGLRGRALSEWLMHSSERCHHGCNRS